MSGMNFSVITPGFKVFVNAGNIRSSYEEVNKSPFLYAYIFIEYLLIYLGGCPRIAIFPKSRLAKKIAAGIWLIFRG